MMCILNGNLGVSLLLLRKVLKFDTILTYSTNKSLNNFHNIQHCHSSLYLDFLHIYVSIDRHLVSFRTIFNWFLILKFSNKQGEVLLIYWSTKRTIYVVPITARFNECLIYVQLVCY